MACDLRSPQCARISSLIHDTKDSPAVRDDSELLPLVSVCGQYADILVASQISSEHQFFSITIDVQK